MTISILFSRGPMRCSGRSGSLGIHQCEWKECRDFRNGECAVKGLNDLWGAIDVQGNLVVPLEWNEPLFFSDGEAWVERNGNH